MLSGGSDSRLLAPLCPTGSKAYHLAGWLSKESQTAERVALEEGLDFTWLKRGQDYIVNLAEESVRINNFNGYFQEAHALGFIDQIKTDSDAVIHGLFSDAFFKGHLYPQKSIPVGFEEIPVPVADSINDVTELVDWLTSNSRSPSYVPDRFNIRQILSDNIEERSDGVVHHGIEYDTVEEAATVGGYFPLTNDGDYNHYGAAIQMCPHRTPFLDTRILDFHLRYPMRYQLRKNIIDDAIECLNKELASIPHGSSNVPLNFPFWIKLPAKYATLFWRKYVQDTPQPHLSHGPWVDHSGLVRTSRFVDEAISENSSFLESLDCVDYGKLAQCLSGHKNGIENNWRELYAIVTLVYRRSSR
jgi:asparagine synthase (glutamine-hydrolysing)